MNGERFLSEYFLKSRDPITSHAKTIQSDGYFSPKEPFPLEKANWVKIILIVCERELLRHELATWGAIKRFQLHSGLPLLLSVNH